jgi:hypothetical protein
VVICLNNFSKQIEWGHAAIFSKKNIAHQSRKRTFTFIALLGFKHPKTLELRRWISKQSSPGVNLGSMRQSGRHRTAPAVAVFKSFANDFALPTMELRI